MCLGFWTFPPPKSLLSAVSHRSRLITTSGSKVTLCTMKSIPSGGWRDSSNVPSDEAMQKRWFPYGRGLREWRSRIWGSTAPASASGLSQCLNSQQVFTVGLTLRWPNKPVKNDKEVCGVIMHTHLFQNNSGLWKRGIVNNRNRLRLHNVRWRDMKHDTVCNTIVKAFTAAGYLPLV